MSREEIDAAIRRHADFELLYDKPYEDKQEGAGRRAVHGREPVAAPVAGVRRQRGRRAGAVEQAGRRRPAWRRRRSSRRSSTTCRRPASRTAGRHERLEFDIVEPYAGAVHPGGRRSARTRPTGAPKRVGISIGPQYGTVGPPFIKDAAREAIKGDGPRPAVRPRRSPSTRRCSAPSDDYVASDEGFARRRRAAARPDPGPARADERRP